MIRFDEGLYEIPEEYVHALQKGRDYDALIHLPAYQRILDFLEARADRIMQQLRGAAMSGDDRLKSNLLMRYEDAELVLKHVQIEIQDAIEERRRLIREIGLMEQIDSQETQDPITFGEINEPTAAE